MSCLIRTSSARFLLILFGIYGLLYFKLLKIFSVNPFDEIILTVKARNEKQHAVTFISINTSGLTVSIDSLQSKLERAPSVDYFSCCGAGHRLSKLSDSYYLAKKLGFSLRVFFGFCEYQEVWSFFFGSQPAEEVLRMTARWNGTKDDVYLKVNNEIPGFTKLIRNGENSTCRCDHDRLQSDIDFFGSVRERFRDRDRVEAFRSDHFVGKTVIGMHIRAGNGEVGDFERKNRTIHNIDQWCQSMAMLLQKMSENFTEPPLLFIATDTAPIVSDFRIRLSKVMPVVDLSQGRIDYGQGVRFGASGSVEIEGEKCLNGWSDSLTDMMILSHADVVVAGRPSSFTQSIPMTMALAKPKSQRKVTSSFCEANPDATDIICYSDLMDWCCRGITSFSLQGMQRYDYRRVPRVPGLDPKDYLQNIKGRPQESFSCLPRPSHGRSCLPYQMPNSDGVKNASEIEARQFRLKQWQQNMQSRPP